MTFDEALKMIDETVKGNDVAVFMKGSKTFPMCGFSGRVVQILGHYGVDFKDVDILSDENLRAAIKAYAKWPTIPQVFIRGEFIGGSDILRDMAESGELAALLKDKLGLEIPPNKLAGK